MRTPFFGPSYTTASHNLADQRCINLYPEVVESKTGKAVGAFFMDPGLTLQYTAGGGPIRGLHDMGSVTLGTLDQLVIVSGANIYVVWPGIAPVHVGTLTTSTGPVSMIDNGNQCVIFDGVNATLVSAFGGTSIISLPFTATVGIGTYQDGFGLVSVVGTQLIYQSNLTDLSNWDALNFTSADAKPDNVVSIKDVHEQVYVFKEFTTEFWIDAGNPGFAFSRLAGAFLEVGCAAAYSPAIVGEAVIWLGQNLQGNGVIVLAQGYQTKRVSTHALENAITGYNLTVGISDAIGFSYVTNGHIFYQITFPAANATWVYDVTASQQMGIAMWHEKTSFANGAFGRHLANCFTTYRGFQLVGDYTNGNVYALDIRNPTDNNIPRKWVRSWRALAKPTDNTTRFNSLRIDMDTGLGVPDEASPQVMLRWTDDGVNYSDYRIGSVGPSGHTAVRVKFNRLGSTRRNSGLDRTFELSSTDRFNVCLIGADLK